MDLISVCVYILVGIMGVAYPILLQVESRLDDKYNSDRIVELFNAEPIRKWFIRVLYITTGSIFVWAFKIPVLPFIPEGKFVDNVIVDSAFRVAAGLTVLLVILFFFTVKKVLVYYTPVSFARYLIELDKKDKSDTPKYIDALSDLLTTSIRHLNFSIARRIKEYMYESFNEMRKANLGKPVEYSSNHYFFVFRTAQELCVVKDKRFDDIATASIGGIWFTGELNESKISEITYSWMWNNLRVAIDSDMDDYVMEFWRHATQFYSYQMAQLRSEFDANGDQINIEQQKERQNDRMRFLEFTFAVGGLLLYKGKYNLIGRMFRYTQSIPPEYPLLPGGMDEIFYWYFRFLDPYYLDFPPIEHKYPFPGMEGVNAGGQIRHNILKYIALLFVRQYSLIEFMVYQKPMRNPAIPQKQSVKTLWLNNIDGMRKLVEVIRRNQELMTGSGLEYITNEWCEENQKVAPEQYLTNFKDEMSAAFENELDNQPLSEEKVANFKETTKNLIVPALDELKRFNNPKQIEGETLDLFTMGVRNTTDKSSFVNDQEAEHINYNSALGEGLVNKIRTSAGAIFTRISTKRYLLLEKDFIAAIQKLNLSDGEFVLVCFGKDIRRLYRQKNIELPDNITVIHYPYTEPNFVGDSVFVLNAEDLPNVTFNPPDQNQIQAYHLELLDQDHNLYASVLDLNQFPELRDSIQDTQSDKNLRRYALLNIMLAVKYSFRKEMKCVQLQLASEYRNRGLPNELNEIEPL
ncbi:MAG: hypothetical protein V4557_12605 [Bacteroidota bacterium]